MPDPIVEEVVARLYRDEPDPHAELDLDHLGLVIAFMRVPEVCEALRPDPEYKKWVTRREMVQFLLSDNFFKFMGW